MQRLLIMSWKVDNVLENTPQLLIQFLIVLMSASMIALPQTTGIQAVFDTHSSGGSLSLTFYYFSIILSLRSICFGLYECALLKKEYNMPDVGKVLNIMLFFCGTLVRILAIVLYFAPVLGILDIMMPYSLDQMISYGETIKEDIGLKNLISMADSSWYTGITLKTSFILFFVLFAMHILFILIVRGFLWTFIKELNVNAAVVLYQQTLHSLGCLLVPDIWRDWDEEWRKGSRGGEERNLYREQYTEARREYGRLVWLYTLENILLSAPSLFTFCRHIHRHALVTPLEAEMGVVIASYVLIIFFPGSGYVRRV